MSCSHLYIMNRLLVLLVFVSVIGVKCVPTVDDYLTIRQLVLNTETEMTLGGSLTMSDPRESRVNAILMKYKRQEYTEGLDSNGAFFAGAQHYFHSISAIQASTVFKIIRLLPKGTALHMHDVTVGSVEYVAKNLTRWDSLYYCVGDDEHLLFRFFASQPSSGCISSHAWIPVATLRGNASSLGAVEKWFIDSMSMVTPTPHVDYPSPNRAWYYFEKKITTISGIANFEPALRDYYYNVLQEFYDDNVMYIEMRGLLASIYRLNQVELTPHEALRVYKEVTDQFVRDHPDFWGAKYIFAPHRFHSPSEMSNIVNQALAMKTEHPDFFAGFDLVGQEDKGNPLIDFLPQLLDAAAKDIKFFFHSGETAWHGTKIDENLLDAILLNTTRFGHGYALASHPFLAQVAKDKGIASEVCPISNQVLRLVDDFRNHPAITLMKDQFPLVIASDGPGMFGASALSQDWYIAFMAMSGQRSDLRFLKQLALNSIEYSAMSDSEKNSARIKWELQWSTFLDKVIQQYS